MAGKLGSKADGLAPIDPNLTYPYRYFCQMVGMGELAAQAARRKGLRVLRVGKVHVVLGRDAIAYFEQYGVDDLEEYRAKQQREE